MCAKSDIQYNLVEAVPKAATIKTEREASADASTSNSAGINDAVYVAKSMTLREDQYMDITSLAAYNKILRKKPDSVSAVVREALDQYLAVTDDAYRYIGK